MTWEEFNEFQQGILKEILAEQAVKRARRFAAVEQKRRVERQLRQKQAKDHKLRAETIGVRAAAWQRFVQGGSAETSSNTYPVPDSSTAATANQSANDVVPVVDQCSKTATMKHKPDNQKRVRMESENKLYQQPAVCMLCKKRFKSNVHLSVHCEMSTLHQKNVAKAECSRLRSVDEMEENYSKPE